MTRKLEGEWSRRGKAAEVRDLGEATALARDHHLRAVKAERDARAIDANARRVAAAIRRDARRQQARHREWLTVSPARKSGRNAGHRRLPRFEEMTGTASLRSHAGADGLSSFHFQWRSRGLRPRKGQQLSQRYKRGEIVRLVRYILRDAAREVETGGIVSSISDDPDEIASVLDAVEELEMEAGRENANVYISMVVSLPHELSSAGRERVLSRIVEALREEELPFAGVLHKPDPGTDQRYFHCHIVTSLRPFRKDADGRYSFAALPSSDLNDGDWIRPLRARIAAAINEEMASLEVELGTPQRVFTDLSYADRGLPPADKTKGKRGPGRNAVERRAAQAEVDRAALEVERAHLKILDEIAGLVTGAMAYVPIDVAAILDRACERVANQAAALAQAARAKAIKAQIAALVRPSRWQRPTSMGPVGSSDWSSGTDKPSWMRGGGSLSQAPSLSKAPALGSIPVLGSHGAIPGIRRAANNAKAPPSPSTASPASPILAEDGMSSGVITPALVPVSSAPHTPATVGSSPSADRPAPQLSRLQDALAIAAGMPFVPLFPRVIDDGTTLYQVDPRYVTDPVVKDKLRLIDRHQRAPRIQRVLQAKYIGMEGAVLKGLTTGRIDKPGGKIWKMFDHEPLLAAAIRSADEHSSFQRVITEARAYWANREAGSSRPVSQVKPAADEHDGLSAEDMMKQLNSDRGYGR